MVRSGPCLINLVRIRFLKAPQTTTSANFALQSDWRFRTVEGQLHEDNIELVIGWFDFAIVLYTVE